ncbi:hypothetical protein NUM3379_22290 [Kineococcus sp. NUM-3379]
MPGSTESCPHRAATSPLPTRSTATAAASAYTSLGPVVTVAESATGAVPPGAVPAGTHRVRLFARTGQLAREGGGNGPPRPHPRRASHRTGGAGTGLASTEDHHVNVHNAEFPAGALRGQLG